ncbi:SEC-C metal-binding domain-containing protein [Achromobacter insolitus]|uniref:SEC-C metal-binding domain-containing protein n=1 Tax=Achromobacter insolitus TaxID=217204 RepID=UPI0010423DF8|nr:SEC-C metal-binding domain-containing protein [Achromobacter insolitus]
MSSEKAKLSQKNQHGLSRTIPAQVKADVRKRCGFGCVICGSAIYDYEHFSPPYADATSHDSEGITLLCPSCHAKTTRGWLSKEAVSKANSSPKCQSNGFTREALAGSNCHPTVLIGNIEARNTDVVLEIDDSPLLWISQPEAEGGPYRINAEFANADGTTLLKIVDNEWLTSIENWDVEVVGPTLTVRSKPRGLALVLRSHPENKLSIDRLEISHNGWQIKANAGTDVEFKSDHGTMRAQGVLVDGARAAISLSAAGLMVGSGRGKSAQGPTRAYMQSLVMNPEPGYSPPKFSGPITPVNPDKIGRLFKSPPAYVAGYPIFLYYKRDALCPCGSKRSFQLCHLGQTIHDLTRAHRHIIT